MIKHKTIKEFNQIEYQKTIDNFITMDIQSRLNELQIKNIMEHDVYKDFNQFNFFEIDCSYAFKITNNPDEFLDKTFNAVQLLFLNQYKKNLTEEDYTVLNKAIKYRLLTFYLAFQSENLKKVLFLNLLKEYKIEAKILTSKFIDCSIGIDFIVVIEDKYILNIHSTNGSYASKKMLIEKMSKKNKVFDRKELYSLSNHFEISNFYNFETMNDKQLQIKHMLEQIEQILISYYLPSESFIEKGYNEFKQIAEVINKNEDEVYITIVYTK